MEDVPIGRKGNKGAALVGVGILFLFGAYLAFEHQAFYRYDQILGSAYCFQTWYPFRSYESTRITLTGTEGKFPPILSKSGIS